MRRRRVRALAAQINPAGRPSTCRLVTGCIVQSVTPGAAKDGNAAVSVWVDDDLIVAPYLPPAPAQGSQVAVLLQDGSPLILGKPVGFPAF